MIEVPPHRDDPHIPQHTCTSPPNHPYPEGPGWWGSPEGDELTCLACMWADGYYTGYDDG